MQRRIVKLWFINAATVKEKHAMKKPNPADSREALKQSEKAAHPQPESFKDKATEQKIVQIDPITGDSDDAIKGIDPKKEDRPQAR